MRISRLCVIGVGLIGGSVARAARGAGICSEVVGVDRDAVNLAKAIELGVIDFGSDLIGEGALGADFVFVATPVGAMPGIFQALAPAWSDQAMYTDAGSTKQNVIASARSCLGQFPANFIPGHPIAGAECSGVEAADTDLFRGKRVILTPVPQVSAPKAIVKISEFWRALGAEVTCMDAAHHDEVLAATSHLPHVLAYALTSMLGRKDEQQEIFSYAAGGFRDFTRIASSNPSMWLDICLANREQIIPLLLQFGDELRRVSGILQAESATELLDYFAEAKDARQRFLNQLER